MPAQIESMLLPPRLPLVVSTSNRGKDYFKDARLVNCYVETNSAGELWINKRPGLSLWVASPSADCLGAFHWNGDAYFILNGTLYKNGVTVPGTVDTTGGEYRFSSHLGATPKMVFGNGVKTYTFDGTTISADLHSIDVDFPEQTVKGIVYLNGAIYVMTPNGEIWGSVPNSVDQAGDWSAINFIASQIEPDDGVYLAKQLVYLVAFSAWSTEIFFDAGNPTGSPLGPVQGSKISYGCAAALSVQQIDDRLFWISSTQSAGVQVSMLDQLNHSVISTKAIDRLLQSSTLLDVASLQLKVDGHNFYILTLRDINITLVYDVVENEWHQWTDSNGNYFPMMAYTYTNDFKHVMLHESNGDAYYVSPDYTNDAGAVIVSDIYAPNFDANTSNRKVLAMMKFVADQVPGSKLYVRFSSDDYQTWSNFRSVSLAKRFPYLSNCGTFHRRAYNFRHRSNTKFRMQAVDVRYDLGTL